MNFYNTAERNVQIVLSLLKENGIKKVIASPGATNESLVASMQNDPYFEMYSCVDERSAAYMACGLAVESGEIVVLSCTGATSSRNYLPGLTEAYYRHIPILAITSSMPTANVGHLYPQCTDRSTPPIDSVRKSFCIESVKDEKDEWDRIVKVNAAISELRRNGGGPVHINLITQGCSDYSVKELLPVRKIERILYNSEFPELKDKKVLVFIGAHSPMTLNETKALDNFCEVYDTVALCDHTSGYKGQFRFLSSLVATQEAKKNSRLFECDVLIHIGDISGDYYTMGAIKAKEVWRVDEDGEFRDKFGKLSKLFQMPIIEFFHHYSANKEKKDCTLLTQLQSANNRLMKDMPELPFSNIWIASQLAPVLPDNSVIHLGILNSLRAWNFFETKRSVQSFCNVGGFGIDGIVSTVLGASLCNKQRLYYAVLGDLAFFYDLNAICNRNISNNIRILLINNGRGVEFHTYKHSATKFGEDTDRFIAAYGHNGRQSDTLVKEFAQSLGFDYITASNKDEFNECCSLFVNPGITSRPLLFEVFTQKVDDADVLRLVRTIDGKETIPMKKVIKNSLRAIGVDKVVKSLMSK